MSTDAAGAVGPAGETAGGVRAWLDQAWAFTARTAIALRNNYVMLLLVVGFPPLFYLTTAASTSLAPGVRTATAVTWGTFGALFASLYVFANQLAVDVEDGRYVTFRSMPVYPSAEFAGRIAGALFAGSAAMLAGLAAGAVDGASVGLSGPTSLAVVVLAFGLVCTLFMLIAVPMVIVIENERYVNSTTSLVVILLFFITGQNGVAPGSAWVGTDWLNYLPNSLATRLLASQLVPADQWAEAGLTPPSMPEGLAALGLVAAYALVAVAVGFALFRTLLYKLEVRP